MLPNGFEQRLEEERRHGGSDMMLVEELATAECGSGKGDGGVRWNSGVQ